MSFIQQGGQFDISLQVTIPNEFPRTATRDIGYTAGIEATHCAPEWTMKCNEMDSIIVVSNHSKNILSAARFEGTDEATGQPIRVGKIKLKVPLLTTRLRNTVNYLI